MMIRLVKLLMVVITLLLESHYSESFSSLSSKETRAEWAVKWNDIGTSNNTAHDHAHSREDAIYYNLKHQLKAASEPASVKKGKKKANVQASTAKFLSKVGLTVPPNGKGDKWITLCEVKARVAHTGLEEKKDTQTCTMTAKGEIKETRVKVIEEWSCSYNTERYSSGTMLKYQNNIEQKYDSAIKLAVLARDKVVAENMRTMKKQHTQNLQVATNRDTAKLTATATGAAFWGGGGNCDLVLEGRVNELY